MFITFLLLIFFNQMIYIQNIYKTSKKIVRRTTFTKKNLEIKNNYSIKIISGKIRNFFKK